MDNTISALLLEHNLSHRQALLAPLVRPAIRIVSRYNGYADLPIGSSKLGGTPDLPPGVEWPQYKGRPLSLLAQFYLPDPAPSDVRSELPDAGMLYFFYDMVEQPWGYDPDSPGAWKVIYSDAPLALLRRSSPPSIIPSEYAMPVCAVAFEREITFPPYNADDILDLDFTSEEETDYWDLVNREETHRLLGYPGEEQTDTRFTAQLASHGINESGGVDLEDPNIKPLLPGVSDWRLLFQVADDNDGGAAWFGGAGGRLFFLIRKQDLIQRKFDNVWIDFEWQ